MARKTALHVFLEALFVGAGLVLLYWLVHKFVRPLLYGVVPAFSTDRILETIFLSGVLFHILFEYSGANLAYALNYCRIAKH